MVWSGCVLFLPAYFLGQLPPSSTDITFGLACNRPSLRHLFFYVCRDSGWSTPWKKRLRICWKEGSRKQMFLFIFICFSFTFPSPQDPSLEVTTLSSWPFAQKEHALCYGTTWPPDSRLRSPQHQWHNWCRTVTVATGGADAVSGPSLVVVCLFCLETATRFSQKQPFSHQYWALENIDNIASKIHISMAWVPSAKKI